MRIGKYLDSNHFAYSLDICAEMSGDREVQRFIGLPSEKDDRVVMGAMGLLKKFPRKKLQTNSEYHLELLQESRKPTKPESRPAA